jgi:hypothetical protein
VVTRYESWIDIAVATAPINQPAPMIAGDNGVTVITWSALTGQDLSHRSV